MSRAWLAIACLASACGGASEHGRLLASLGGATELGAASCLPCHPQQSEALGRTVHAKTPGCERCHGPGSEHMKELPKHILGPDQLGRMSARGRSEMCLRCHRDLARGWSRSAHADALSCARCHPDVVHFEVAGAARPPGEADDFCDQCHAADTADFDQVFHHPVPEGDMRCADCHSIHGERRRSCARCHRPQSRSRVFRHAALDEGCAVCHQAHGAPLRGLLRQRDNHLCLQCHFAPGFPLIEGVDHRRFLAGGALCFDCHVEVHGSDTDPSLLGGLR